MKDNINLIESIRQKQAAIINDLELLKASEHKNIADIEAIQTRQAEIADDLESLLSKETRGGESK